MKKESLEPRCTNKEPITVADIERSRILQVITDTVVSISSMKLILDRNGVRFDFTIGSTGQLFYSLGIIPGTYITKPQIRIVTRLLSVGRTEVGSWPIVDIMYLQEKKWIAVRHNIATLTELGHEIASKVIEHFILHENSDLILHVEE